MRDIANIHKLDACISKSFLQFRLALYTNDDNFPVDLLTLLEECRELEMDIL